MVSVFMMLLLQFLQSTLFLAWRRDSSIVESNIFNDNSPLILYEMMCTGMSNIDLHMYKDRLMNDGNDNIW